MTRLTDLPGEVTTLLTAVVEALDIPLPSNDEDDEAAHYDVLDERAAGVRIALSVLLEGAYYGALKDTTRYIRERTAQHPVTYTPFRSDRTGAEG
ncbi:hypothetical protein [Streptomyces sp. NRRL F-5727]|uniref:hypothetical protein n=1 Tax=Streptomyces sp. NRRL F-5727 TaxID=1463871 RepID=UPI0004C5139F|nr:hypothetical protein [Streptomyces sp. NRRL F-5727]